MSLKENKYKNKSCNNRSMNYTVVIRTLGTAGEKYQSLLDSLEKQSIAPSKIIVYIAENYPLPKETIGTEHYVYVKKGMVAQRALRYDEVDTDYILFCDDDVYLPPGAVEELYHSILVNDAQVIAPDVFNNARRGFASELLMTISGRMRARRWDQTSGYKIMLNGGYSYNKFPKKKVYLSETNAGPCFFCRKEDFLKIHFEDELWLDKMIYPLGEDQVMFYKMHCLGLKILTHYKSGIEHLDAGTSRLSQEKENKIIYSDFYFKCVFWHRFIYLPERNVLIKLWSVLCILYTLVFAILVSTIKYNKNVLSHKLKAIKDARSLIGSETYKRLPRIVKFGK